MACRLHRLLCQIASQAAKTEPNKKQRESSAARNPSRRPEMAKEKFEKLRYVGPLSSFSVLAKAKDGEEPDSKDRSLVPGVTYDDLPADHPVIQNLIAGKLLITPAAETVTEAPAETAVADSTNTKIGDDRSTSATTQKGDAK
jgi:hypothetical protein